MYKPLRDDNGVMEQIWRYGHYFIFIAQIHVNPWDYVL